MNLPQDRALPGMEQVRIKRLDDVCHDLSEIRAAMAQCRQDEGDSERIALELMHRHQVRSYHASGVELAIVPGEEKLRVRTQKGTTANAAPVETGDGQDPAAVLEALDGDNGVGDEFEVGS